MKRAKIHAKKKALLPWELRLYVANETARSMLARANLRSFCDKYLPHECDLRIIDIMNQPAVAAENDIVAIPTLVRVRPYPKKTVIGTLSDVQSVLRGLGVVPRTATT